MTYTNIMESVKSLEKAYEYHQNEEKLLNEIDHELKEYWNLSDLSHKVVTEAAQDEESNDTVSTKMAQKQMKKS